ncbi:hypothetical protein KAJ89_06070 [Candidatus Parcubacteria bacterium]|nr:hypothetical protein [Candidatus Parcubacteria bacterium]
MENAIVKYNQNVLRIMANDYLKERTVCPVCGKQKDFNDWTCPGCKEIHGWMVMKLTNNLKIKLSPPVFDKACNLAKQFLENTVNSNASYQTVVEFLVKSMPEITMINDMLPLAALEGAVRKAKHEMSGSAETGEEYEERRQQLLSELPHETMVEIDVITPDGEMANPKKFINEGFEIEGVLVPGSIIVHVCDQVNAARKEKRKNWYDSAWQNLIDKISKEHTGYIDISKIVEAGFVFKGKTAEDEMVRAACYEVINERRCLNRPRIVTKKAKMVKTRKPKKVTNSWAYHPCGANA